MDVRNRQIRHRWSLQNPGRQQMRLGLVETSKFPGRPRTGKTVRNPFFGGFSQAVCERGGRLPHDDQPDKGKPGQVR